MANVGSIATLHPKLLQQRGYTWGSFVEIRHPERDTMVIRQLIRIRTRQKIKPDSVYVDPDAMHLLCGQIMDQVEVLPSDYDMPFP